MAVSLSHTEKMFCDRVAMTRLVAVLCMIYVHVPDGQSERVLHAMSWSDVTSLIQGLLIEGPGRAGASLLSIVSGYLTAKILLLSLIHISEPTRPERSRMPSSA